jgi:hypothetical protein
MFLPMVNLSSVTMLKKLDLVIAPAVMAPHNRDDTFAVKLHEQLTKLRSKLSQQ